MDTNTQQQFPFVLINSNDWNVHQAQLQRLEASLQKVFSEANQNEFLTPEETAKLLKISLKTLANWRERNLIEFFQVGSNIRFTKRQIEEFIQKNSLKTKY